MRLVRHPGNPILPPAPGTWMEDQTANPDLLRVGPNYHLYFRGQARGHDRIGLGIVSADEFDGFTWNIRPEPVIDVGPPGSWDETHVLDPATVCVDGTIFLYYSAVCPKCPRSVCLATSRDGVRFRKYEGNPVVIGGGPEIAVRDGTFYLYYWVPGRRHPDGFELFCATSRDGFRFHPVGDEPILPTGDPGAFDAFTVETPRIFEEHGTYHMLYCGSSLHQDYPFDAGLATSRDLLDWRKFEGNPIFSRGGEGEWDEGAIWFPTVEKIGGRYYLWYEGYGGGTARREPYGSYLVEGRSQIGLATLDAPYFFMPPGAVLSS